MRHQNYRPERPEGEGQQFHSPRAHFGPQQELGGMSFSQSAQFHHAHMANVYSQMRHGLPGLDLYGFPGGQEQYMRHPHRQYPGMASEYLPQQMRSEHHRYPHHERFSHHQQPEYGAYQRFMPPHYHPHHPHGPRYGQYQQDSGYPQNGYGGDQYGYSGDQSQYGQSQYGRSQSRYGDQSQNGYGDQSGNQGRSSIYTYDGARRSNPQQAMESAKVVAETAKRLGVDPVMAVAAMLVESGGNPKAVGDNGHSFGLFQLNYRGELAQAHLSAQQAFNPQTNAEVALSYFRKGHVSNPGAVAAAAQRPANRADYARKVNSNMAEAAQMVRSMGLA